MWLGSSPKTNNYADQDFNAYTIESPTFFLFTADYVDMITPNDSESVGAIEISDYLLRLRASDSQLTSATYTLELSIIQKDSSGTTIDSYSYNETHVITIDDDGYFNIEISGTLKAFYLNEDDYLQYLGKISVVNQGEEFVNAIQTYDLKEIIPDTSRDQVYFDEDYNVDTVGLLLNQFSDDVTFPSSESTGTVKLFNNSEYYTKKISYDISQSSIGTLTFGKTGDDSAVTYSLFLRHYSVIGVIQSEIEIFSQYMDTNGDYTVSIPSLSGEFDLEKGEYITLEANISAFSSESSVDEMIRVMPDGLIYVTLVELPPSASSADAFKLTDLATYLFNVVGCDFSFNPDIESSANKDNLNSVFGAYILSGMMVRGFDADDNAMSITLEDLLVDARKLFGLGVKYTGSGFYMDYITNLMTGDDIEIGEVSDCQEEGIDIPIQITLGTSTSSDIEDFYLKTDGHNETYYAYPATSASEDLDYTTSLITRSNEIELVRRNNADETEDLTLNSDTNNYIVMVYDFPYSESEERLTIITSPDNFGDVNLALLPTIQMRNNREFLRDGLFRKISQELTFTSSDYSIDLSVSDRTDTFVEQDDIEIGGTEITEPILFTFKKEMDNDTLSAIKANPNHPIIFEHLGEKIRGYIYSDTEIEIYMRNGNWTVIKAKDQNFFLNLRYEDSKDITIYILRHRRLFEKSA